MGLNVCHISCGVKFIGDLSSAVKWPIVFLLKDTTDSVIVQIV